MERIGVGGWLSMWLKSPQQHQVLCLLHFLLCVVVPISWIHYSTVPLAPVKMNLDPNHVFPFLEKRVKCMWYVSTLDSTGKKKRCTVLQLKNSLNTCSISCIFEPMCWVNKLFQLSGSCSTASDICTQQTENICSS